MNPNQNSNPDPSHNSFNDSSQHPSPNIQPRPLGQSEDDLPSPIPDEAPFHPFASKAKRDRKKLIIIVAAALVVLLGGFYAVYALWYNNPNKVVADALTHLVTTKQGDVKADLTLHTGSADVKFAGNLQVAESGDGRMTGNLDVKIGEETLSTSGEVVATKENLYVKVNDARKLANSFYQAFAGQDVPAEFNNLLNLVDGKWVVITSKEYFEMSGNKDAQKQSECVDKVYTTFQTDKKQQGELANAYQKNQFIVVKKTLPTEAVNGASSLHYELSVDSGKFKSFSTAAQQTSVFKALDACYGGELAKSLQQNGDATSNELSGGKLELWVDQWSHKPTKLSYSSGETGQNASIVTTFNLGKAQTITVPKGETTVDQLQTEFDKVLNIYQSQFEVLNTGSETLGESVLGVSTSLPN